MGQRTLTEAQLKQLVRQHIFDYYTEEDTIVNFEIGNTEISAKVSWKSNPKQEEKDTYRGLEPFGC